MLRKYLCLVITVVVILIYILIQKTTLANSQDNNSPTISFDSQKIVVSVKDDESKLLEGVSATDEEDGNMSNQVFIESLSSFVDNHTRRVNYIVYDSDENITKASRLVEYSDYVPPVFSLNDQLRAEKYSVSELTKRVKASSCIDGDISSKVSVINVTYVETGILNVKLGVSDSTNTSSYLSLNYYLESEGDIDIELNQYLVYLKQGDTFNYRENIKTITEKLTNRDSLKDYINIDVPIMNKAGVYEVNYSISRSNGNSGKTTMVVVVE